MRFKILFTVVTGAFCSYWVIVGEFYLIETLPNFSSLDSEWSIRFLQLISKAQADIDTTSTLSNIIQHNNSSVIPVILLTVFLTSGLWMFILQRYRNQLKKLHDLSLLSTFLEKSPTEISVKNNIGGFLWANEYARKLYGLDKEKLKTDKSFSPKVSSSYTDSIHDQEQLVIKENKPIEREYEIPSNSNFRTIRMVKFPVQFSKTQPNGIGTISIDITKTKRNESRFQNFADVAFDWYWEMDENLRFTYQSERFEEITGIPVANIIGKTHEEAFEGSKHGKLLEAHQSYSMIFELERKDGSVRTLQTKALSLKSSDGTFLGYSGIGSDISETTQAKSERTISEQRFRDFADIATDYLWETDAKLRFSYVSDSYPEVSGLPKSEMLGKTREEVWTKNPPLSDGWKKHLQMLNAHLEFESFEFVWLLNDGTIKTVILDGKRLTDEDGRFRGYRGITRDVTEILKARNDAEHAQEIAESANQAKSDFLANISHEIRTPMTLIIGMTDLIQDTELNNLQKRYINAIKNAGDSLLTLINRILDMSKIESGFLSLSSDKFNLEKLLERLTADYAHRADEKNIAFSLNISPELELERMGDRYRLEQVLRNLLDNALKFTNTGEISISAKPFDPQPSLEVVLFCISDTGIGIPKEQQKKVFDSFVQQDSSTTRKYGGTGLGLSICKQIVNAMGGDIWITGAPGKGSNIFFTTSLIPLTNPINKHKEDVPILSGNLSHSLKILIVEDDILIRTLLNEYLSNSAHRITNALNGQEAVELVQSHEFDLVIMDLRMPIMDGYTAIQKIRSWETGQFRKPLSIVALSASVMVDDVEQCLSSGFNAHLGKPIQKDKLLQMIDGYGHNLPL